MSIELKQAAQDAAEAIDWLLKNIRLDAPQLSGKAMGNAEKCASALRTAIQQAEAQQPANAACRSVQKRLAAQQPATATACGIPGMAKTTCPYCEQGFAFEHEPSATPELVVSRNPFASRCYTMSESHLSGHRLIVGFEKLGDAQDAHEWVARQGRGDFTNPAPSVPKDDQIAALVNKVRDIARVFHDHQSLRERIAIELVPALKTSQEVKSDAERYRWLRDNWFTMGASYPEDTVKFHLGNARWSEQPESNLDAAIDAAMLAGKTGGAA